MQIEARDFQIVAEHSRPNGRSTIDIKCPFCGKVTMAFVWSLRGSGKRCECGAKHTWEDGTIRGN